MSNLAEKIEQTTIPLDRVRRDGGTQMRDSISEVTVITYAEHMQDGAEFPPITLFFDGTDYWLADGFHRCGGYERAGVTDVPADIRTGQRIDAVRYALKANATNGRPRTSDDMRRAYLVAVENELCEPHDSKAVKELLECSDRHAARLTADARVKQKAEREAEILRLKSEGKTDREVASAVGVDASTVNRVAKRTESEMQQEPAANEPDDLIEASKREKEALYQGLERDKQNRYAKAARRIQEDETAIQSRQNQAYHEEINAEPGDVFIIGRNQKHKLIVGDSFDVEAIKAHIPEIDCVLTDPPYGISYKSPAGSALAVRGDYRVIESDDQEFDPAILFKYSDKVITWGANHYGSRLQNSAGWLVWDKRDGEQINNNSDCELAWTNMIGSARLFHHRWNGMIKASEHGTRRIHPTQKPIKLFKWCLEVTGAGQHVVDMFAGSGSSLIACDETGRTAYLVEKDPVFASALIKRMQDEGFKVVRQ